MPKKVKKIGATVDPADELAKAEESYERSIRQEAMAHVPAAMKTLAKFSSGKAVGRGKKKIEPTAAVVRSSARDIIEFAGGRPETRDPRVGDPGLNLTIVINRFGDGSKREYDVTPHGDSIPAASTAAEHLEELERRTGFSPKTFEIPDEAVVDAGQD